MRLRTKRQNRVSVARELGRLCGLSDGLAGAELCVDPGGDKYGDVFRIAYGKAYLASYTSGRVGRNNILLHQFNLTDQPTFGHRPIQSSKEPGERRLYLHQHPECKQG